MKAALLVALLLAAGLQAQDAPVAPAAAQTGQPSADQRKLAEILSRREFTAARREAGLELGLQLPEIEPPDVLTSLGQKLRDLVKRFFDWLERWLSRQRPERPSGESWVAAGSGPLTWALVAAAAALLALLVARFLRRRRGQAEAPEVVAGAVLAAAAALPDALSQPADGWARFADEFAREGQWRLALRALYLRLLVVLHERGALRYERQRTNGDYLRALRDAPAAAPFGQLTRAFDLAWYGNKPFEREQYEQALAWTREVDRLSAPRAAEPAA